MLTLLRQEKVLQVRGVLALLMFAAFNIFWSALVLPLSAPPFAFRIRRSAPWAWSGLSAPWRRGEPVNGPIADTGSAPAPRPW
jgi:hypothetical protein